MLLNNLMAVKWKWHYDISFYIAAKNALGCEKLFNHYTMLYTTHHNMLIRNAEKLGQNHWIKNKNYSKTRTERNKDAIYALIITLLNGNVELHQLKCDFNTRSKKCFQSNMYTTSII